MFELIIFGTIGFWIGLIVAVGLIIYFLESALSDSDDNGGGLKATAVVAGFVLVYYFFGSKSHIVDLFEYLRSHTGTLLLIFGVYIALGVVWAFAKWYFFLLKKRDELNEKINTIYVGESTDISSYIPKARENKKRIISWMTYWPFSGIWTLINDPVRRAFQFTYTRIESYFDKVSNKMFADQKLVLEGRVSSRKKGEDVRKANDSATKK